ncbi:hypothetical protein [Streptomyces sp. CBMA152]|uniref:hypothetical protein n=1 Tax=Streptomyces sp. CBMA152 TaxID=1896312 RepID=UPI00166008B7|nr:hypothetical protein [Streptomyces sp. CBMA152]MBD0744948.1 hypothetical protein [Streptomyces sp. CBMA152]
MPNITAAGRTAAGSGWQQYVDSNGQTTDYAIYIDIDTTVGGFIPSQDIPTYTASLGGDSRMWDSNGAQCVYQATHTGFRIYLRANFRDAKDEDQELDVAFAQANNWFINWQGIQQF